MILCICRPTEHSDASPPFQWSVGWKWTYSYESLTNGNSEWIPAAASTAISYAPIQDGSSPWYGSSWWPADGSIYSTRAAVPTRYVFHLFRYAHLCKSTESVTKECSCLETVAAACHNMVGFVLGLEWTCLFNSLSYIFLLESFHLYCCL